MNKSIVAIVAIVAASAVLTGCNSVYVKQNDALTGQEEYTSLAKGAGAGAIAGAVIGLAKGDGGKGALKGALIGGALGGGIGYYMDSQEAKLRQKMSGTGITVTRLGQNQISLNMPGYMTFDTNQSVVRPQLYRPLNGLVTVLNEYPNTSIQVIGHTDNTGSDIANMRLSNNRAQAVRQYLIAQGIESSRIDSYGEGSNNPVASNSTEAGRQANRRVEIRVVQY